MTITQKIHSLAGIVVVGSMMGGAAYAGPASINSTQLGVTVAPISFSATRLGGFVDSSGNGLTAGAPPTVDTTGALLAGTGMTAAANTTFNLSITARAGDAAVTTATAGAVPNTAFGIQSGRYSRSTPQTAAEFGGLSISAANAASVFSGTREGVTATAIFATEMKSAENSNKISRIATSSNDQATFSSERQAAKFQFGGSGLTAVTAEQIENNVYDIANDLDRNGFEDVAPNTPALVDGARSGMNSDTALGATPTITVVSANGSTTVDERAFSWTSGATQAGVAFTKSQEVRTGQAGATRSASSTDVTQPGYGIFTNTLGGTTAGAITATNMNTLGVAAGGAGTSSTLSVIQSLSAF